MNKRLLALIFFATALHALSAPFNNLGFDEYDQSLSLMPGWQLFNPAVPPSQNVTNNGTAGWLVGLNSSTIGSYWTTLYDVAGRRTPSGDMYGTPEGNYALALWTAHLITPDGMVGDYAPWEVVQNGQIPADAKTIRYLISGRPFDLRINDTLVPIASIAYENPLVPYGPRQVYGDISAFAGQTVELKFSTVEVDSTVVFHTLDGIIFSPQIIPEPSMWALLGLGGSILLLRRRVFGSRH